MAAIVALIVYIEDFEQNLDYPEEVSAAAVTDSHFAAADTGVVVDPYF